MTEWDEDETHETASETMRNGDWEDIWSNELKQTQASIATEDLHALSILPTVPASETPAQLSEVLVVCTKQSPQDLVW